MKFHRNLVQITFAVLGVASLHAHPDHASLVANDKVASSAGNGEVIGHNGLRYRVNRNWSKADPEVAPVTNAHAMIEDENGQIFLVTDDMANAFIVYEKDGTFVRSFGKGLKGGHGIDLITLNGEECLIHVDAGWHQTEPSAWEFESTNGAVTIVSKKGEVLKTLPSPHELGLFDEKTPFKPCDVAVTPNNDILVVDGYSTDKVLHYKSDGSYVGIWGGKKEGDPGHLQNAHGISIDQSDPENPKVWVSSRAECKLKAFTLDGEWLETIEVPGALAGQVFFEGDKMYSGVCWSKKEGGEERLAESGFVLVLDRKSHRVVSAPGGSEPIYEGGKLLPLFQKEKVFTHVHDLYVDSAGDIYVGEWNSGNRYPYKLELIKDEH